ncbi:ABC transporter ATP-binding protein [candidate division NPL-UPA2 bacterium]|nr:ABC transporter ATP-binding protein [candidate division NPL-UPA2 bacterium]
MSLLSVKNVEAYYSSFKGFIRAVDGVSLDINYGDVLGLAGESGCGKSTLSNVLMMNISPPLRHIGGEVIMEDNYALTGMSKEQLKTKVWGKMVARVPQSALNALVPTRRIRNFVGDVIKHHLQVSEGEVVDRAEKRFRELGLPIETLNKYPHELSGGMKQRVVISIATLLNPKLLIVDEPTSALDVSTQKQVLGMLMNLVKKNIVKGIIFIAHDIATLRQIVDRVAIMYAGKIVEISPIDRMLKGHKRLHPYTESLIRAVITPEPEVKKRGLSHIPGDPPDLRNPPSGCRFHLRCPQAIDICTWEEPSLTKVGEDSLAACHLFQERNNAKSA